MIHELIRQQCGDLRALLSLTEHKGVLIRYNNDYPNIMLVYLYMKPGVDVSQMCDQVIKSTLNDILANIAYHKMVTNQIEYFIVNDNMLGIKCDEKYLLERLIE